MRGFRYVEEDDRGRGSDGPRCSRLMVESVLWWDWGTTGVPFRDSRLSVPRVLGTLTCNAYKFDDK